MSDTLRGYTVRGGRPAAWERRRRWGLGKERIDATGVELRCNHCDGWLTEGFNMPLDALVRLATEHSGRCLG